MVGLPRRDRCHTCRKRKIKCNGGRPHCGPCITNGRTCLGYPDAITFLGDNTRITKHGAQVSRKGISTRWPTASSQVADTTRDQTKKQMKAHCRQTADHHCHTDQNVGHLPLPHEPSLTWLRFYDSFLGEFIDACLPSDATTEVPLSWLRPLMSVNKHIDALPLAMSALAVGWAGHVKGSSALVDQGLQVYSFASSQLRAENPYPGQTQFLATTVLLALYELFEFGDERNKGWICHAAGITTSLRTLKPEGVLDPLCGEIFRFVRTLFTIQSLKNRRKACAASSYWMTLPFVGVHKSGYQQLLDLGLGAGELIAEADQLDRGNVGPDPRRSASSTYLLDRFDSHLHALRQWELANMHSSGCLLAIETRPSPDGSLEARSSLQDHDFPGQVTPTTLISYDDLSTARTMQLYWSVTLTIYSTLLESTQLRPLLGDRKTLLRDEGNEAARAILSMARFCPGNLWWQSYGALGTDWVVRTAVLWRLNHGASREQEAHASQGPPTSGTVSRSSTLEFLEMKALRKSRLQLMDDFQQAAFGNVDVLALPWCLMEDQRVV